MFRDWLLCDFHIHTRLSDGELPLEEVINLYGMNGLSGVELTNNWKKYIFWRLI